jgi:hypothetical protein
MAARPTSAIAIDREHERRPDDRADRDILGAFGSADDRHDRDRRLRKGGRNRGEKAARSAAAELEPVREPLDGVRKEDGSDEDDGETSCKEQTCHGGPAWSPFVSATRPL